MMSRSNPDSPCLETSQSGKWKTQSIVPTRPKKMGGYMGENPMSPIIDIFESSFRQT